jgi:4-amino-4-deoxychorismate lyase
MKHLNRLEQVLIRSRPLDEGFDDWLVTDTQGNIIETSAANLFLCVDGQWYTPSLAQCGVAGVMRQQVIAALLEAGYHVSCTQITPERLAAAGQVFITNSLFGLVDIRRIDSQHYSIWPHTAALRQSLGMNL